jgi:2-polyprenyl-3-methyl-5-hydroxy-6-metoxy-1,4-benzoquinol methylase
MHAILEQILARIEAGDRHYGQQLRQRIRGHDENYFKSAAEYFLRYDSALRQEGKSIDFGVDCYLKMSEDMTDQRVDFVRSGKYANRSYKEVEQRIYGNPTIMEYHMHGLALAQYLWPEQYERIEFFRKNLTAFAAGCKAYLEVGGGHGLYALTALGLLAPDTHMDLLDISASSIKLAQQIIGTSRVNYIHKDIFDYTPARQYDFITAGEIVEHLEIPLAFLEKLASLLHKDGTIFFTTSINAPMIDHIYLFSNADEIRQLIAAAGLQVIVEKIAPSRDLPPPVLAQHRIPVMFGAFLRKR